MIFDVSYLEGIGTGEKCVIVGGGMSRSSVDLSKIPFDVQIISCNLHAIDICAILIHHDAEVGQAIREYKQGRPHIIISAEQNKNERTTHTYKASDIQSGAHVDFGDTGFHALQLADCIFNYSEIYLIGYDYLTTDNTYHWNEDKSDTRKLSDFRKHSIGVVLPKLKAYKPKNKVYLMSQPSALDYKFVSVDNL